MRRECPNCAVEVPGGGERCPICGYEFPEPKSKLNRWGAIVLVIVFLIPLVTLLIRLLR